jgi:subtilase family serine protease
MVRGKKAIGRATAIAAAALALLGAMPAQAAGMSPNALRTVTDLGANADGNVTVSVLLKNSHPDQLENLIESQHTPGDPQFHKFLSAAEFHGRFDPSDATIAEVSDYFRQAGLSVRHESGHILEVSGSAQAVNAAFGVALHTFEMTGHERAGSVRFHAALSAPTFKSASVADAINTVVGLDNSPHFAPHSKARPAGLASQARPLSAASGNTPGQWTVTDFANYYNVTPLYNAGYHGEGRTLGIVTLASFTPSDAFEYWHRVGLATDPHRISIIELDGGSGPISDDGGSGETTLDVEQAGGLAPAARIRVYEAPNTDQAFVDAFYRAVNENLADSISTSWGAFEWFYTQSNVKTGGRRDSALTAFNQIFMQAAAQGQTLFAAAGDDGAYDANRADPVPQFNPILSVDAPAASPYITATGGTTLPGTLTFTNGTSVTLPAERVWGWDYLTGFCASLGYTPVTCGTWGVGGGGGVSSYFAMPSYQKGVAGMQATPPNQSLVDTTTTPATVYVTLPARFEGRNVPDVAFNADPETGYAVDYTSDTGAFSIAYGWGGTSFVAPQLNGLSALLGQKAGGRLGLLNYPLYALAKGGVGYAHPKTAPLVDIAAGDNWYYQGVPGYDQGSGVGTLNVWNFSNALAGAGSSR